MKHLKTFFSNITKVSHALYYDYYLFLLFTEDRLIMKQVQMVEITSFIDTALQYFQHVTEAIKSDVSQHSLYTST